MPTKTQRAGVVRLSLFVLSSFLLSLTVQLFLPPLQPIFSQEVPVYTYGAQLLLVQPKPGQALPTDAGIAIHARLAEGDGVTLIASGPVESAARLQAAGFVVDVLDSATAGQVYYFIDKQAEQTAGATSRAAGLGRILYEDDLQALLALPDEEELRLVETLPPLGIAVSLLNPAPLPLANEADAVARIASPQSADPTIAALLPQLTEADLSSRIAQLSGDVPVMLPGGATTLATRYTFSPRILDAERFLHDYYTNLGLSP